MSEVETPRARGRVLKAVEQTWPGFASGAVESRAGALIEAGDHAAAAAVLERGIERYGPGAVSQLLLAWCLHEADRQEDALVWTDRAVADEPENADALWLRANVLFELDRPEEAVATLRRALELTPGNGRFHMRLAWFRSEDAPFAETRELVREAVALAPDDAWVQHTAGRIYDNHLRHRRAQPHFERALELAPGDVDATCDLAELLQARGRLSSGVRLARQALDTAEGTADEAYAADVYDGTLWRWSLRWYEWALRAGLALSVLDWILPTPVPVAAIAAMILGLGYAAAWTRSLAVLPSRCRRDLLAPGRRWHFVGSFLRTALAIALIVAMLLLEPTALQHLGILGILAVAYAEWLWQAIGKRDGDDAGADT